MITYHCLCGTLEHTVPCARENIMIGDLVLVEYMPRQFRESHKAAGNSGRYPHNGAIRAAIHHECAEWLTANESGAWFEILDARDDDVRDYAQTTAEWEKK